MFTRSGNSKEHHSYRTLEQNTSSMKLFVAFKEQEIKKVIYVEKYLHNPMLLGKIVIQI